MYSSFVNIWTQIGPVDIALAQGLRNDNKVYRESDIFCKQLAWAQVILKRIFSLTIQLELFLQQLYFHNTF